jgi:IS30 family transposase
MKFNIEAILAELPDKPPRSRLDPHLELIQELRLRKWTFQQIANLLAQKYGVGITSSGIHDFLRRRTRSARLNQATTRIDSARPRTISPSPSITESDFEFNAAEPLKLKPRSSP